MCKEKEIDIAINKLNIELIDTVKKVVTKYRRLSILFMILFIVENIIIFGALAYFLSNVEIEANYKETTQTIYTDKIEGGIINENSKQN